ncbi:MAG TPA: hypothetical protein ENK78_01460 [Thiothrix sp.]|nr:hypothetical protein [Thiothrix sp.]
MTARVLSLYLARILNSYIDIENGDINFYRCPSRVPHTYSVMIIEGVITMTNPRATLETLLADVQTLQIATVSAEQQPHVSYVPCIVSADGDFYVLISDLAQHTQNLRHNNQVSILIMNPVQETQPVFARTRLNYQCCANRIDQSDPQYPRFLDQMAQQFGEIISLLRQLPDFHLFRFTPQTGSLVIGFGQAYQLNTTTNSEHHRKASTQLLTWEITLIQSEN